MIYNPHTIDAPADHLMRTGNALAVHLQHNNKMTSGKNQRHTIAPYLFS
jgi:hypothetical protein